MSFKTTSSPDFFLLLNSVKVAEVRYLAELNLVIYVDEIEQRLARYFGQLKFFLRNYLTEIFWKRGVTAFGSFHVACYRTTEGSQGYDLGC